MTETSLPWGGTTTGDAGPYSDSAWSGAWRALFAADNTVQGVIPACGGELAASNPAGVTLRLASGAALVDGKFYHNSAALDFTLEAPAAGSSYYTLALRKSWAAQTVRAQLLGPDPAGCPAPQQVDGACWDIPLAGVQVSAAGAVALSDARAFILSPAWLRGRQGGDSQAWAVPGAGDYPTPRVQVYAGRAYDDHEAAAGSLQVTFPAGAFAAPPIIFVASSYDKVLAAADFAADGHRHFHILWRTVDGSSVAAPGFSWLALGL